ncbi:MAG: hypothetical protein KatS3mg087_0078 [Patescibacteria group bacterium]|nr:MAG: hypothetical protein KatS3mg087_0078 [Patescibacteria group bacterium]
MDIPCTQLTSAGICETDQYTTFVKNCENASVLWKCVYLNNTWQWERLTEDCELPHAVTPLACHCPEPSYPCNQLHQNEIKQVNCRTDYPKIVDYDPARYCELAFLTGKGWQVIASSQASQNCNCNYYIPYLNTYMADFNPVVLPMPCIEEEEEPDSICIWECVSGNWVLVGRPSYLSFLCSPPLQTCDSNLEGVQEGTEPVTTTPAPRLEPSDTCLWRCGPYQEWEIVRDCRVGNYCPEPEEDCTYDILCAERYTQCYTVYTTTSSTTTTTQTPESQCAKTYCRWICTVNPVSKEFEWVLNYPCPEGCTCVQPTGPCNASNVCVKQAIPCVPEYESPVEPDYGCCQVLCSGGRYVLVVQDCQGDYRCAELDKPCYLEGDLRIFQCSPPETTTTTQSTSTTEEVPNYSEGYCTYQCADDKLILVNSNCSSGYYCPDIIKAYCTGSINYIQCLTPGSEFSSINNAGLLFILPNTFTVETVTTASPISVTFDPGYIYMFIGSYEINLGEDEPEFKPCPGNCMYTWNPEDKIWILYSRTCSCHCFPPSGSGPDDATETREGICGETAGYLEPPEFEAPQWPQPIQPIEVSSSDNPDCSYDPLVYPNGICKYECYLGVYRKICQNCILDKNCSDIYIDENNPICNEGDILTISCQ